MKTLSIKTFYKSLLVFAFALASVSIPQIGITPTALAAGTNLIKNPSFETEVTTYWDVWSANSSTRRNFTMTRSYEVPVGYGSYSAAIQGTSAPVDRFEYGIITNNQNPITLTSGKNYVLSFYAKAQSRSDISVYLVNTQNFQSVTTPVEIRLGTDWTQYQVILTPTYSGAGALTFATGDLGENVILNLDGLDLSENNITFTPNQTVSGLIGQANKTLKITNGGSLTTSDVKIELPYFNEQTNTIETKQFAPATVTGNSITFTMPEQTFGGIGKVYLYNTEVGKFNYNVFIKISDFAPKPVSADEDITVYGSGFNPIDNQTFVLVSAVGANGGVYDLWLKPHTIDSNLSQAVIKLPIGITNGSIRVKTYYTNLAGVGVENKSSSLAYKVKPSIYNVTWSKNGYEQVGDKISIYGKGISKQAVVNFYDDNGKIIFRKNATLKTINTAENYEVIEVATPVTLNKLKITVQVGSIESDQAEALYLTARPIINSITTKKKRTVSQTNTSIPAAKPGEKIRIIGKGFKTAGPANIEIATVNGNIIVPVWAANIDPNGNWIDVTVPNLAITGTLNVEISGKKSNSVSLEIIPIIVSTLPLAPFPGTDLQIWTQGVGSNLSQTTVYFNLGNNETVAVKPSSIRTETNAVVITVFVPKSISNNSSTVKIQYGNWLNDETYKVSAKPYIDSSDFDLETKILTIKGHGFSPVAKNNKITYMYIDHTVVNPKVKMLGVQNTSEGQEIKIQVLDTYHYGFIKLAVNEDVSNEVSVGPAIISRIQRRTQYVNAEHRVMGVLYISGKNFGTSGGVKVGDVWANVHYRSNTFIIAVVETGDLRNNPVIVAK
jgi:hypothetical protein